MTPLLWVVVVVLGAWGLLFVLLAVVALRELVAKRRERQLEREVNAAFADAWFLIAQERGTASPHDQ